MREFLLSLRLLAFGVIRRVWVLGLFLALDLPDIYTWYLEPSLLPEWRQRLVALLPYLLGIGVVLSIGLAYHELRMKTPHRLIADMRMRDAFDYLVNDSRAYIARKHPVYHGDGRVEYYHGAEHLEAMRLINEMANSGELIIFGRRANTPYAFPGGIFEGSKRPIPKEYWLVAKIEYSAFYHPKNLPHTAPLDSGDKQTPAYTDLHVCKAQLRAIWPKKALWERLLDKAMGEKRILYPAESNDGTR